jgi:LysW-gamma-L-lysine carboxypeptidase
MSGEELCGDEPCHDELRHDELLTLRRLVEIASPSGHEAEAVGYLAARMAELGYTVRTDFVGNVIGEIGSAAHGPTVMMVGHIDTVPGEIAVRESGGVLYGRGTVDAKGPLAAMVHAGARAAGGGAGRFPGRIVVVGAVDEEGLSRGARRLAVDAARPDALVIGEPSGVGGVVVGYKGLLSFDYRVRRPAAHTSTPSERAVEVACDMWHALRGRLASEYADRPQFDRALPALVSLEGGIERARARVSCRVPRGFDPEALLAWVRGFAADTEVRVLEQLPAVRTGRADPLTRAFAAAVRRRVGEPRLLVKLGTSDMNILAPHWSLPAVAYGPGDSALDHTDHEHIVLDEYLLAIRVLADALPAVAADLASGGRATLPPTAAEPQPPIRPARREETDPVTSDSRARVRADARAEAFAERGRP